MPYVHVIKPAVMALGVNGWIVQGVFLTPDDSLNTLEKIITGVILLRCFLKHEIRVLKP